MEETGFGFMLNGVFYGVVEMFGIAVAGYAAGLVVPFLMSKLMKHMAGDEDVKNEDVQPVKYENRRPTGASAGVSASVTVKDSAEIDAFAAAGTLFKTRQEVARFFRDNPKEHFATPRGQEVVKHYLGRYEEYLRAIGDQPDASGIYHDSHWTQVKKYLAEGRGMRELPSLPPKNSRHWRLSRVSDE